MKSDILMHFPKKYNPYLMGYYTGFNTGGLSILKGVVYVDNLWIL